MSTPRRGARTPRHVCTSAVNPRDVDVAEIGDELAAARALAILAEKLRLAAAGDIESFATEASHGW
jgi:hypothetical protein